jgi:hypothetical protein
MQSGKLEVSGEQWLVESLSGILSEWGGKYRRDGQAPTFVDFYVDTVQNKVVYRLFFRDQDAK